MIMKADMPDRARAHTRARDGTCASLSFSLSVPLNRRVKAKSRTRLEALLIPKIT